MISKQILTVGVLTLLSPALFAEATISGEVPKGNPLLIEMSAVCSYYFGETQTTLDTDLDACFQSNAEQLPNTQYKALENMAYYAQPSKVSVRFNDLGKSEELIQAVVRLKKIFRQVVIRCTGANVDEKSLDCGISFAHYRQ